MKNLRYAVLAGLLVSCFLYSSSVYSGTLAQDQSLFRASSSVSNNSGTTSNFDLIIRNVSTLNVSDSRGGVLEVSVDGAAFNGKNYVDVSIKGKSGSFVRLGRINRMLGCGYESQQNFNIHTSNINRYLSGGTNGKTDITVRFSKLPGTSSATNIVSSTGSHPPTSYYNYDTNHKCPTNKRLHSARLFVYYSLPRNVVRKFPVQVSAAECLSIESNSRSEYKVYRTYGVVSSNGSSPTQPGSCYKYKGAISPSTPTTSVVPPVTPPTTNEINVTFTNRWKNSKISFNGNDEWVSKSAGGNSFYFCEKKRPTYCLNILYGDLRSTVVSPVNADYSKWELEEVGGYKKIKSSVYPSYYIHHEKSTVQAGSIQSGWWSAQWKMKEVEGTPKEVEALSFLSKSDSTMKLTVGGNSEWVLTKDTMYGTNAYKICGKNRSDYCLNIEHNYTLQNSKIQVGWYSALWTIKKFPDGSIFIRSKWKPNKYLSINSSGVTLTTDKNIKSSGVGKYLLDTVLPFFISTANAELTFGDRLIKYLENAPEDLFNFKDIELWEVTGSIPHS